MNADLPPPRDPAERVVVAVLDPDWDVLQARLFRDSRLAIAREADDVTFGAGTPFNAPGGRA